MPISEITPSSSRLPRSPLVSDNIAKAHNVFFAIDTRFRRCARLLQALWLKDHDIDTGIHVRGEGEDAVVTPLHSNLERTAAAAGKNFLSPDIHAFVRHELLLREDGAAIDEERLFSNALSSMPMTFNLFAPLALDLNLAKRVFQALFPSFVDTVKGFAFEHSPGRREERFLGDGTAFDLAVHVTTPAGEPATIYIETKYSEDMSGPAARPRDRYNEVSRTCGLFIDPDGMQLRSLALEQLWRENMLAQLCVDQDITPRAIFVGIGPRLNRRVMAAFRVFESVLVPDDDRDDNRVPFVALTLERVIEAIDAAGANELARTLWARYADFERIYHLCLDTIAPNPTPSVTRPFETKSDRKEIVQTRAKKSRASSKRA